MLKHILLFCFLTLTLCTLSVDPERNVLRDEYNRIRVMHGVNVVYKEFPYHPIRDRFDSNGSLVEEDFVNLKKWGFNSIRLYIAWEGFEPKRHQYNYTYLEVLKGIVREAQKYGISVMIDAHHDLYSKRFCGQGFPTWLGEVTSFPAPFKVKLRKDADGLPLKQDCMKLPFFKYYVSYDVVKFSHDFFTNKNGMNDKFIQMWLKVVDFFKNQSNVIGYDILNEPTGGNFWKNPYAFIGPDQNNNRLLLPFYKKISIEIRHIEKDKLLFFEPAPQDLFGGFYSQFGTLPQKDVLNYHTYCPLKNKLGSKDCDLFNTYYMKRRNQNMHSLRVGGVMTQFGSVPDTKQGRAEIKSVTNNADKYLLSWYYWQFKYNMDSTCSTNPPWLHSFYYPNATLQIDKVKTLAYSYAYAICGKYSSQTSNPGSYSLTYFPANCQGKNTELFLNQQFDFPDGFVVKFNPPCQNCGLRMIERGYFEVLVDEALLGKPFTVKVGAKIEGKEREEEKQKNR